MKKKARDTDKLYLQINENEYIYVNSYDPVRKQASNFTLEHFEQNNLKFKIAARRIRWIEKDSIFRLSGYKKEYLKEIKKFTRILQERIQYLILKLMT